MHDDQLSIMWCQKEDPQVEQALSLSARLSPKSYARLFSEKAWGFVVAVALLKREQTLIGMATISISDTFKPDKPELAGLWIHPAERKKGFGRILAEEAARRGVERYGSLYAFGVSAGGRRLVDALGQIKGVIPVWGGGSGEDEFD